MPWLLYPMGTRYQGDKLLEYVASICSSDLRLGRLLIVFNELNTQRQKEPL